MQYYCIIAVIFILTTPTKTFVFIKRYDVFSLNTMMCYEFIQHLCCKLYVVVSVVYRIYQ